MTPPIDAPPAIVQPMPVAWAAPAAPLQRSAAGQRNPPTVQLPISLLSDPNRASAAVQLGVCASFTTPHKGTNLTNGQGDPLKVRTAITNANTCVAAVEVAVRNGKITDAPALVLALRSIPFFNDQGDDKVAETLDEIATQIATRPENTYQFDYNPSTNTPLVSIPFTSLELGAATIVDGRSALQTMMPSRSIPVDPSTSYIMTAADVVVHPTRYIAEGKTMAETVATARARHTADDDKKLATLCMINDGSLTLRDCQGVAGRNTLEMMLNGQAGRYDADFYRPSSPR